MQIVLVRHGESEGNVANEKEYTLLNGQYNCHLTEKGRAQAAALHGSPVFDGAEAFFCSDLIRTKETASYFADPALTIYEQRLRERSLGIFDGLMLIPTRESEEYRQYFKDPTGRSFRHGFLDRAPGGENYTDVCARVGDFFREIRPRGYRKIVIVSHFCTIRCIEKLLLGLSEEETLSLAVRSCDPILLDAVTP